MNFPLTENRLYKTSFSKYGTCYQQIASAERKKGGSLFRLTYHLKLKTDSQEKNFIDELRCRNGNLEITVSRQENVVGEL